MDESNVSALSRKLKRENFTQRNDQKMTQAVQKNTHGVPDCRGSILMAFSSSLHREMIERHELQHLDSFSLLRIDEERRSRASRLKLFSTGRQNGD